MSLLRWLMDAPYNTYMASIIEDHPQRAEIDRLILAGKSVRYIASCVSPNVSVPTIQRYRAAILRPAVRNSAQAIAKQVVSRVARSGEVVTPAEIRRDARDGALAAPFVSRLAKRAERRERWMQLAENGDKPDFRALSSLDSNEGRDIELEARLTGALDAPATNVTAQVLVLMPDQHDRSAIQRGDVIDVTPE